MASAASPLLKGLHLHSRSLLRLAPVARPTPSPYQRQLLQHHRHPYPRWNSTTSASTPVASSSNTSEKSRQPDDVDFDQRQQQQQPQPAALGPVERSLQPSPSSSSSSSASFSSSSDPPYPASSVTPPAPSGRPELSLPPLLITARNTVQQHLSELQPRISTKISELNHKWNAYTGFESINALKKAVSDLEASLAASRLALSEAKARYLAAVSTRSASQRATNDLLSRRSSWSEQDLSEYTRLLRSEHQQAKEEEMAEKDLDEKEREVQTRFDQLMKGVMTRYHEEQIWSDRVRSVSTYGSIAVVALNAVLFVLAILIVEPYKRKKLAQTFETRLLQGEEQGRQLVQQTIQAFDEKVERLVHNLEAVTGTTQARLLAPSGDAEVGILKGTAPPPAASLTAAPEWNVPVSATKTPEMDDEVAKQLEDVVAAELGIDAQSQQHWDASDAAATETVVEQHQQQQQQQQMQVQHERATELAVASTAGLVAGAVLSVILGACWGR
ncbi:sensitivity to high expression protein she9 [Thecaphora frezii]